MLFCCPNLKAIRYESTSLNKIVTDKSHRVIVIYECLTKALYLRSFTDCPSTDILYYQKNVKTKEN